jgi:hypothetical protein
MTIIWSAPIIRYSEFLNTHSWKKYEDSPWIKELYLSVFKDYYDDDVFKSYLVQKDYYCENCKLIALKNHDHSYGLGPSFAQGIYKDKTCNEIILMSVL